MHWIDALYAETKQKWNETGNAVDKYAIFFSPVVQNPKIALIGYNPGGSGTSISVDDINVPAQHEYLTAGYRIAVNVKKVFDAAQLDLNDTVKFNLIFFRTRAAAGLRHLKNYKELIRFSEQKVVEILARIKPQYIITEGFATFERLLHLIGGTQIETITYNNRTILLVGKTAEGVKMFGMLHPTGAFGISNALLEKTGNAIRTYMEE